MWNDYKEYVKEADPESRNTMEEEEAISSIVSTIIKQRNTPEISKRELAAMCGIPQSSVVRIESFKTTPNLEILKKINSNIRKHMV